jgi:hypothetical protein
MVSSVFHTGQTTYGVWDYGEEHLRCRVNKKLSSHQVLKRLYARNNLKESFVLEKKKTK